MKDSKNLFKSVLVTGGAGFIGSHLVDTLLERGFYVVAIDNLRNGHLSNLSNALRSKNFKFIKGDILNQADCLTSTKDIDCIFHLACLGIRHSIHSPLENHKVNAEGTLNMLEASLKNNIRKFFYISSSEVYGDINKFPIKETDLPVPKTIYGSSKLAGENYCYSYFKCYDLDVTILRFFNNYGPRSHYEGDCGEIIPRTIISVMQNKSPVIYGDGSITRDFFYVLDSAKVMADLIGYTELKGEIINIGKGDEISMKNLIETILILMNKDKDIKIRYIEGRPADVPRLWVDNSKFKSIMDYSRPVTLSDGLRETIMYFREIFKNGSVDLNIPEKNWKIQ